MSLGIVAGLAFINSGSLPPSPSFSVSTNPAGQVQVGLYYPQKLRALNRRLEQVGVRVRVVPIENPCSRAASPPPRRVNEAAARRYHGALWVATMTVEEPPKGETSVILSSPHGLIGVSYRVHDAAPTCLPAAEAKRFQQ